jgi:DNA polymerase-3 subunit epsilon
MLRQLILDTETTGISPELDHRIIEIGCVELVDRKLTGNHYHVYLNPERGIDEGAFKVHGISSDFLKDKPLFKDIVPEFLQFIDGAELIIHNAPFDVGFLNAEFTRLQWEKKLHDYCLVIDTLVLAREKHPGQRNNLDALCKRYDIDNSNRQWHGALLDAEILARVYLAMTGGQTQLFTEDDQVTTNTTLQSSGTFQNIARPTKVILASDEELLFHDAFIDYLIEKSGHDHWSM